MQDVMLIVHDTLVASEALWQRLIRVLIILTDSKCTETLPVMVGSKNQHC